MNMREPRLMPVGETGSADVTGMLIDHLDLWTGAVTTKSTAGRGRNGKIELTGIKKLRELILELAVRGKLVEQNPNDEPASVLLEKIAEEKARLVKEGKIKKPKKLPEIDEGETPFSIPHSWTFVRLGEAIEIVRGITFPASEKSSTPEPGRIACLRTSNIQDRIEWGDLLYIRDSFVSKSSQYIQEHDIVMSMANSRELVGKVAIIEQPPIEPTTFGGFLGVMRPTLIHPRYLMAVLRAPNARRSLIGSASQTTNIANISIGKLNPFIFGLPPLEEQNRIVEKVDELMALCDRLEQQVGDQLEAHEVLVDTLLDALTRSAGAAELAENWARIAEHFDTLFTTESSIDKLKQTILQLAVMGRLVPQDPSDQPTSLLLEKIAEEKARLIKEGKIKKQKMLINAIDKEVPFKNPTGWSWACFDELALLVTSGSRGWKAFYSDNGSIFIRSQDIKYDKLIFDEKAFVSLPEATEGSRTRVIQGDLLITITGANVAKAALVDQPLSEAYVSQHVALVRLAETSFGNYIHKWLTAIHGGRRLLLESSYGAKPGLNLQNIKELLIPLPPVAEQNRIVERIDELATLCDRLKARLGEADETRAHLAEAMVENAVK